MDIIKTDNAAKIFQIGKHDELKAVSDASLAIKRGEIAVLKGPSGSGKTTLLSLIGCMSRPTSGGIFINGKNVAKLPERFLAMIRRETFGFIFQQFHLVKGLSVLENIMLPLYPTEMKFADMKKRAAMILADLDIAAKQKMKVELLSGGEAQRVAIARALMNEPDIILADEPTAHLDTKLSQVLLDIFRTLQTQGKTIVIATHDPLIYDSEYVNRIIEMRDGVIQEAPI